MEYQPVPVSIAAAIANAFDKSIVVINSWDDAHKVLHTTTYGVNAQQKEFAAAAGVITAQAMGASLPESVSYEDFRIAEFQRTHTLRPLQEWHEDFGPVMWWLLPVQEPPYCGTPMDCSWPGYHTHWSHLPKVELIATTDGTKVTD